MSQYRTGTGEEGRARPTQVEGLIDLNVLPARYRPSRPSVLTVLSWLLVLMLIGLLIPSTRQFQEATAALSAERVRLRAAQARLEDEEIAPEQIEAIEAELEAARARASDLHRTLNSLELQHRRWGPQLRKLVAAAPEGVLHQSIQEEENLVTINAWAEHYGSPLDYAAALRSSGDYGAVILQGIQRIEFEPEDSPFQPTASAASAGASATPTAPPEAEAVIAYSFVLEVEMSPPEVDGDSNSEEGTP